MKQTVNTKYNNGFTLIEVMISIVLLGLIAIGTSQYFVSTRLQIQKGARLQAGQRLMSEQVERALSLNFTDLLDSIPENSTPIDLNGSPGYRTTVLTGIDDPSDNIAPIDLDTPDYYEMKVIISTFNTTNVTDSVTYFLTEDRYIVSSL